MACDCAGATWICIQYGFKPDQLQVTDYKDIKYNDG
jgi:hypothetical protein